MFGICGKSLLRQFGGEGREGVGFNLRQKERRGDEKRSTGGGGGRGSFQAMGSEHTLD